ncbi:MAG: GTPase [Anaerolineae bacterium]
MREEHEWEPTPEPAWGVGSILDAFDWDHVRAEVEQESQARIAIVGLRAVGKSSLLNRLRGWEVSPAEDGGDGSTLAQEDLGLFVLVDLPDHGPRVAAWPTAHNSLSGSVLDGYGEDAWTTLAEADLIVFVLDGEAFAHTPRGEEQPSSVGGSWADALGLRTAEYQWFCRIRSLGRPLIVALNKVDLLVGQLGEVQAELERRLAASVIPVSAQEGTGIEARLLPRMLDACPVLAVPLGREMPAVRRRAAIRLIRQAALLSALTGLEPVPLLDIPIQLAAQMRLLLRLAALHGRLGSGDGSRELLATVAGGLGLRLAAQQVAKLVPVLGWAVSGLLSGLSTWFLGRAAVAYFDGSWSSRVPALRRLPHPGRMRETMGHLGARVWAARARGWKLPMGIPWRPPDTRRVGETMGRLKARASDLGPKWITGLTGWTGGLAFRHRSGNPLADSEPEVSSLGEGA